MLDWDFLECDDIELIWKNWKENIFSVMEKHTKVVTIKQGNQRNKPWITNEIRRLIRKKQAAELAKDYHPSPQNFQSFRVAKKQMELAMFEAKQNFYHGKIEDSASNPHKLWSIMRDIAPASLKVKSKRDTEIPADTFAKLFSNIGGSNSSAPAVPEEYEGPTSNASFELSDCNEDEILRIINRIPEKKANGVDGIPMKIIKIGVKPLLKPLTKLINLFIKKGFPMELKRAIVLPIFKKGPADIPSNYRPISLLSCISKIAERAIANQLTSYLEKEDLLSDAQHGFRRNHSTNSALLYITETIRGDLDKGRGIGLVALDLSKAFDTIDHGILINKLRKLDIGEGTIAFLKNYLSGRTMIVKTPKDESQIHHIKKGVPQGSILGPLLFTIYVNDLPKVVKNCSVVLYADDTTLFTGSSIPSNIQIDVNEDLVRLEKWFHDNKLHLNTDKTEYILITNNRRRQRFEQIKISVAGKQIKEKEEVKILGVTIKNDLTWDTHTGKLIKGLRFCFRSFSRSCRMLTRDTRKLLYNSAIASRMNYCDTVWDCCSVNSRNKMQTIQNRCARRILNHLPGTTAPPLINELGWISLDRKRKMHKCVLLHRLINGRGPSTLIQKLTPFTEGNRTRTTRSVENGALFIPGYRTDYIKKSFFHDTVKEWNQLPLALKSVKNNSTFKEKLYLYYLGGTSA